MSNHDTVIPKLNKLQWSVLDMVRNGKGLLWPNDRRRATLRALANRKLVDFTAGSGWSLTLAGESAISAHAEQTRAGVPKDCAI